MSDERALLRLQLGWLLATRGGVLAVTALVLALRLGVSWMPAAVALCASAGVTAVLVRMLLVGRRVGLGMLVATVTADACALLLVLLAIGGEFDPVAMLWGTLVALSGVLMLSAGAVYVTGRVRQGLAAREAGLEQAREEVRRNEKLASLATLAAGTAHELATPLSTIAVVASELARTLEQQGADAATVEDARLIRQEVERCRRIIQRMAADAGETPGGPVERVPLIALLQGARDLSGAGDRVQIDLPQALADEALAVPLVALEQAVAGVMRNAVQASPPGAPIRVSAHTDGELCVIEVHDRGHGMAPEVLARAGEPFFTSKEPGQGMGLGLFLTRAVLDRLGGRLTLNSNPGQGTCAELAVPWKGLRLKAVRRKGKNDTTEKPTTVAAPTA
jgi:two-component system sensor histidine kinase RegB